MVKTAPSNGVLVEVHNMAQAQGRDMITEHTGILLPVITIVKLKRAEEVAIMLVQKGKLSKDYEKLRKGEAVGRDSALRNLSPFLHVGLIRVGGRLKNSDLPFESQYPLVLPKQEHITCLIVRDMHASHGHVGRNHTLALLRQRYWVMGGLSLVRNTIHPCITCQKVGVAFVEQKMADLPRERITSAPPFSFIGVDYFGPFVVQNGRKWEKRWGVMFTCLSLRSVHCKMAYSLSTDAFILAMRRFISRRGTVEKFYSDNGKNFIEAERELARSLVAFDQAQILSGRHIARSFNPPYSLRGCVGKDDKIS